MPSLFLKRARMVCTCTRVHTMDQLEIYVASKTPQGPVLCTAYRASRHQVAVICRMYMNSRPGAGHASPHLLPKLQFRSLSRSTGASTA